MADLTLPKCVAAAVLLFGGSAAALADGCKFAADGRMVPEREQRALVEWTDGSETLYVAALSDPMSEGTVWVVPVRAAAAAVRAEPVEEFPAVVYYRTLKSQAVSQLRDAIAWAAVLDSGGVCCLMLAGGCGEEGASKGAAEASRVEKLGMVVTVVSAGSRAEIERYLDAQGVNRAAADLSPLDPYVGDPGYAFVCGWLARRDQPTQATGLKIFFPSPDLWFPLRPTRAYTEPVETVVYARGFVKPASGLDLPGLMCEYIDGEVKAVGVGRVFGEDRRRDGAGYYPVGRLEPFTRVTLATDPRKWHRDLELVPGTTAVGTVVVSLALWGGYVLPFCSALLGAILGLVIARLTVPRTEVFWADWLAGALTGATIVFTVWASVAAFATWQGLRFNDRPSRLSRFVVLPGLAVVHFLIVWAVCRGLISWMG